jgi:hypothetical protein
LTNLSYPSALATTLHSFLVVKKFQSPRVFYR